MMWVLWMILMGSPSETRSMVVERMGLNTSFAGWMLVTENVLTIGERETRRTSVETVDVHRPRWTQGPESAPRIKGFDGTTAWTSSVAESLKAVPQDEQSRVQNALRTWRQYLLVLLLDAHQKPVPLPEAEGRLGFRLLSPEDGSISADVYLVDGLPGEVRYYGRPDPSGDQRISTNHYSDYRSVEGRLVPFQIRVSDSYMERAGWTISLTVKVRSWTFFDTLADVDFSQAEPALPQKE